MELPKAQRHRYWPTFSIQKQKVTARPSWRPNFRCFISEGTTFPDKINELLVQYISFAGKNLITAGTLLQATVNESVQNANTDLMNINLWRLYNGKTLSENYLSGKFLPECL